jgi:hypothetical protein
LQLLNAARDFSREAELLAAADDRFATDQRAARTQPLAVRHASGL